MASGLDIIVFGATGYTGRLIAEYLNRRCRDGLECRWGISGRFLSELEQVVSEIGAPTNLPLIVADSDDLESLMDMCVQAKLVIAAAGPYQWYGSQLVAACAATGTDYVDLSGETPWMRAMIEAHHETAKRSGARIVFSGGFDAAPFDLGVFLVQELSRRTFNAPAQRVHGYVRASVGGISGGSFASYRTVIEALATDPVKGELIRDPFALTPGFVGPYQPDVSDIKYDDMIGAWVAPNLLAAMNSKCIHRSNLLLDHAYGVDFVYEETAVGGPGEVGRECAQTLVRQISKIQALAYSGEIKPGEGPSKEERDGGHYDLLFVGEATGGGRIKVFVTGDRDPFYGSTAKIISECALCLLTNVQKAGGIWSPAALLGHRLAERLVINAGLTFSCEVVRA